MGRLLAYIVINIDFDNNKPHVLINKELHIMLLKQ